MLQRTGLPMKKLAFGLALALALLGGAVIVSAVTTTHVAACPNNGC
jgi:hypothetical protein